MKYSLCISTFHEDISSLFHDVVFLYFFAMFSSEGFLISSCYYLELCIQMCISFLFSFAFKYFAFLNFFFLGVILIIASCTMLQTTVHSFLGNLSIRSNPLHVFVTSTVQL